MPVAVAKPATYAPDPRKRSLLAMVHIAPKQLDMDDDDYRAVLLRETGCMSAKDCTVQQLDKLMAEFRRLGFSSTANRPGRKVQPPRADHALARKARVMWISLAHLCAIETTPQAAIKSDKALEAFAKRQLGCERLQWADQTQGDKLIEALKAIAIRHGWDQSQGKLSKATYVHALKVGLCYAILAKLKRAGFAGDQWTMPEAAFRLVGMEPEGIHFSTQEYERLAAALGRHLRAHAGRGAFAEVA